MENNPEHPGDKKISSLNEEENSSKPETDKTSEPTSFNIIPHNHVECNSTNSQSGNDVSNTDFFLKCLSKYFKMRNSKEKCQKCKITDISQTKNRFIQTDCDEECYLNGLIMTEYLLQDDFNNNNSSVLHTREVATQIDIYLDAEDLPNNILEDVTNEDLSTDEQSLNSFGMVELDEMSTISFADEDASSLESEALSTTNANRFAFQLPTNENVLPNSVENNNQDLKHYDFEKARTVSIYTNYNHDNNIQETYNNLPTTSIRTHNFNVPLRPRMRFGVDRPNGFEMRVRPLFGRLNYDNNNGDRSNNPDPVDLNRHHQHLRQLQIDIPHPLTNHQRFQVPNALNLVSRNITHSLTHANGYHQLQINNHRSNQENPSQIFVQGVQPRYRSSRLERRNHRQVLGNNNEVNIRFTSGEPHGINRQPVIPDEEFFEEEVSSEVIIDDNNDDLVQAGPSRRFHRIIDLDPPHQRPQHRFGLEMPSLNISAREYEDHKNLNNFTEETLSDSGNENSQTTDLLRKASNHNHNKPRVSSNSNFNIFNNLPSTSREANIRLITNILPQVNNNLTVISEACLSNVVNEKNASAIISEQKEQLSRRSTNNELPSTSQRIASQAIDISIAREISRQYILSTEPSSQNRGNSEIPSTSHDTCDISLPEISNEDVSLSSEINSNLINNSNEDILQELNRVEDDQDDNTN